MIGSAGSASPLVPPVPPSPPVAVPPVPVEPPVAVPPLPTPLGSTVGVFSGAGGRDSQHGEWPAPDRQRSMEPSHARYTFRASSPGQRFTISRSSPSPESPTRRCSWYACVIHDRSRRSPSLGFAGASALFGRLGDAAGARPSSCRVRSWRRRTLTVESSSFARFAWCPSVTRIAVRGDRVPGSPVELRRGKSLGERSRVARCSSRMRSFRSTPFSLSIRRSCGFAA